MTNDPTRRSASLLAAEGVPSDHLSDKLQQQCVDWGVYWRAPDAHGVNLSHEQALELLRDALGVEVEIAAPKLGKRTTSAATASSHEIPDSTAARKGDCRCEVANGGDARVASGGCALPDTGDCDCTAQDMPFGRCCKAAAPQQSAALAAVSQPSEQQPQEAPASTAVDATGGVDAHDLDLLMEYLGALTDGGDRFDSAINEGTEREQLQSVYEQVKARWMSRRAALATIPDAPAAKPDCHCEACDPIRPDGSGMRMIVCATCGNKRCPHATNHRNACTNSNDPGQKGSSWEHYVPPGDAALAAPAGVQGEPVACHLCAKGFPLTADGFHYGNQRLGMIDSTRCTATPATGEQAAPLVASPDHTRTLKALLVCCQSWEPDACVLGNVRAGDAADAIRAILAAGAVQQEAELPAEPSLDHPATPQTSVPAASPFSEPRAIGERELPASALKVLRKARTTFGQVETDAHAQSALFEWWSEIADRLSEMDAILASTPAAPLQAAQPAHGGRPMTLRECMDAEDGGAEPHPDTKDALVEIRQAIRDYHYALDTRQHGGVAQDKAYRAIEEALGMPWQQGKEAARRAFGAAIGQAQGAQG